MTAQVDGDARSPRERIIRAAYPLFSRRGVRDVSIEDVQSASGLEAADVLAEFSSKDEIVAAFLVRREREWTRGLIEEGARTRATTPEAQLLAIFDVLDDWFHRDDYEACTFINVMLEMGKLHPLGIASAGYLTNIREMVTVFAAKARLRQPAEFARSWHILMKGAIISAVEGDLEAAGRAKRMGRALIEEYRPTVLAISGGGDVAASSINDWEWDSFGHSSGLS